MTLRPLTLRILALNPEVRFCLRVVPSKVRLLTADFSP
jgi:hypothetical protein